MAKSSWVIEFDYDGDPDLPSSTIVARLKDELAAAKGRSVWKGSRVTLDRLDDAFAVRMRFCHNVVGVTKTA